MCRKPKPASSSPPSKAIGLLEGPLKKALRLVCERGLAGELKTYDGCFNIRPMKSGRSLSVHSWGLALDFNAETNPFQYPGPSFSDMVRDFSDDFVRCFAEAGFEWGGIWKSVKDPMHFQLPWTQDWQESSAPLRPEVYSRRGRRRNLYHRFLRLLVSSIFPPRKAPSPLSKPSAKNRDRLAGTDRLCAGNGAA